MDVSVSEFYTDKTVFITGGSGFIGKVLVEKLLRCCPVRKIFLLMRPKKGGSLKARYHELIRSRAFDNIRQDPLIFEKLHLIRGDILQENLGMSDADRQLVQEETNIVFHSAACVKFDMFIRDAVQMNVVGTRRVLELVEGIHNLDVFVHLSTTYCRSDLPLLEEKVYPSKHNPDDVIHLTKWMDDGVLKHLEPKLIEPEPNTYGYTKSLAEQIVAEFSGKFPICIARPSIVVAALKEPFPGWVDNINGPTAIIVGASKGILMTSF
ncbi:putative fatty acyl-CoA reductase CG5065 isoform X2 [Leptidea sinapis]|uniref:putative fatty acyl-CoA reductase CG5065 isoform X2 n=1 Tax=Leptidea sinapis TaxID=189913 RepID=UPI0021C4847C|nr:putative fatty acyl-CoA reductase CG5065 isoform X2 [Leptidea sinapis]